MSDQPEVTWRTIRDGLRLAAEITAGCVVAMFVILARRRARPPVARVIRPGAEADYVAELAAQARHQRRQEPPRCVPSNPRGPWSTDELGASPEPHGRRYDREWP